MGGWLFEEMHRIQLELAAQCGRAATLKLRSVDSPGGGGAGAKIINQKL